ncbi:Small-conductance mechanosensitive channel [Arboricoccus pini]|uniref:Small-conductance mechanosensitive channel n=1 Tax=Arboricoccus pini TaxID=1963835 RepID=A0A212RDY1_9PROT|nr:mechanosensitive ion channel family protein [Arboricoccus pini]SNB70495.1 Small-conductance mechanosensitive channel [Arboricoccus pini]
MDEPILNFLVTHVQAAFAWAPAWVGGLALMLLFAGLAFLLHGTVIRILERMIKPSASVPRRIINRSRGPLRLGLVILALAIVVEPAGLPDRVTGLVQHVLLVGSIILVGWVADTGVDTLAGHYMRRFRTDVEDNLVARKHVTQVRVLRRLIYIFIVVVTSATILMTFEPVRQYGVSLLASAGAAGLVVGLAARPVLANIIAGLQLAITQPIRLEDAVVVEGEWGWIEEITGTYVVIRIWDWRRLIVPLSYFMEKPFQNWTRESGNIIGSVFLYVDYTVPVERVRAELDTICRKSPLWDGKVVNLQVSDAREGTIELRALVSGRNSPVTWDLRCEVREKLIAFLQAEYPGCLPRQRIEVTALPGRTDEGGPRGGGAPSDLVGRQMADAPER